MVLSSSSYMHHSHRLAGCHATGINSLLISFLLALWCLYLLHQATSFTWIIVSSSKLSSSGQILLRSIVARPISSLKSVTLSELTKTMSPLENTALSRSLSIFFVTRQLGTNLIIVGQHQQVCHTLLEFYIYQVNILT